MADTTNLIDIQVKDGVNAEIAPKLISIADAADRADKSVGSLKAQLTALNSSGLVAMLSVLQGAERGVSGLARAKGTLTEQVKAGTSAVTANVRALAAESAAEERAQARWQRSIEIQERQLAMKKALAEEREKDASLRAFGSQIGDLVGSQLESQGTLNAAKEAQVKVDTRLAASSNALSEASDMEANAYRRLAAATVDARTAKASLAEIQKAIADGDIEGEAASTQLAAALKEQAAATEQLRLSQSNLVQMQAYLAQGERAVTEATEQATAAAFSQGEAYGALRVGAGAVSGSTNMMLGGFARLLSTAPAVASAMNLVFPVLLGVAFVEIIYQTVAGMVKYVEAARNAASAVGHAFDASIETIRKENDALAVTNDKLDQQIAKIQHKPTTNGVQTALDEAREAADKLDDSLDRVQKQLDSILGKNQVSFLQGLLTNQAGTKDTTKFIIDQFNAIGEARSKANDAMNAAASMKDAKAAHAAFVTAKNEEASAIQTVIKNLTDQYNAAKKLQDLRDQPTKQQIVGTAYGAPIYSNGERPADQTAKLTDLGKSIELAKEDLRGLQLTYDNIGKTDTVDRLRDSTSQLKAQTRAAAEEWKRLEANFVAFQAKIDETTGHKATAQQSLDFLRAQQVMPQNQAKLAAKELPFENQLANGDWIDQQTARLKDQVNTIGLYDDSLREAAMLNSILEQARRKNIDITPDEVKQWQSLISKIVESRDYERQLEQVYKSVNDATDNYTATLQALNTLYQRGQLTQAQYTQGIADTAKQYREASDAVVKFKDDLAIAALNQRLSLGTSQQQAVGQQLQALDDRLRQRNADANHPFGYSEEEIAKVNASLAPLIAAQQRKNAVDQQTNDILTKQANLEDQLAIQNQALATAVKQGAITQEAANLQRLKGQSDLDNQSLANGKGNPFKAAIEGLSQFKTVGQEIKDTYQDVFKTLSDGFADSIGRAIVYGKDLGSSLKEVARQGIGELISGMIKLGIQYAINATLGESIATASTAASTAQAAVVATAWAPAAAMVSLASFGANAGAADAGIVITSALAQSLAAIPGHATGGYISGPGTSTSDSILSRLSAGEYVVNAAATARNRNLLDAINKGGNATAPQTFNHSQDNARMQTHVEVHNYGSQHVEVQQLTEDRVRVIVREETPHIVANHAPRVISQEIANPNSSTSKAITRNVTSQRIR
jgi:hypothetical protein